MSTARAAALTVDPAAIIASALWVLLCSIFRSLLQWCEW
jgi:hypothetical protein